MCHNFARLATVELRGEYDPPEERTVLSLLKVAVLLTGRVTLFRYQVDVTFMTRIECCAWQESMTWQQHF